MAELQTQEAKRWGVKKGKRLSTRVDLTPMVDLGFLLITFFIFTTALREPTGLFLPLPQDNDADPPKVGERKTISLLLDGEDVIRYYQGNDVFALHETNYSAAGLRSVLLSKVYQVRSEMGDEAEPVVIIHPLEASRYGNLVDVLDEMMINGIRKYILVPPPPGFK